jgi:hypothetical protein
MSEEKSDFEKAIDENIAKNKEGFNHTDLPKIYKGITSYGVAGIYDARYVFKDTDLHDDYLELFIWNEEKEWSFLLDNYPFPRKRFTHQLPVRSIEDFESDLERMGIPIPEKITLNR